MNGADDSVDRKQIRCTTAELLAGKSQNCRTNEGAALPRTTSTNTAAPHFKNTQKPEMVKKPPGGCTHLGKGANRGAQLPPESDEKKFGVRCGAARQMQMAKN